MALTIGGLAGLLSFFLPPSAMISPPLSATPFYVTFEITNRHVLPLLAFSYECGTDSRDMGPGTLGAGFILGRSPAKRTIWGGQTTTGRCDLPPFVLDLADQRGLGVVQYRLELRYRHLVFPFYETSAQYIFDPVIEEGRITRWVPR
jgi:hypothetical protein